MLFRSNPEWIKYDVNYDNAFNSLLSMFILSTLENWNNIMKLSIYAYSDKNDP